MPDKSDDIILIRKYLNGELNARAMHELERRALDDPFLMEALEGYEQAGADQQANLDDLTHRLQERVEDKKVKRMIPWLPLSIAASVLVIIAAGIFFLRGDKSTKPPEIAQATAPEQKKSIDTTKVLPIDKNPQALADNVAAPVSKPNTISSKKAKANNIAKADQPPVLSEIKPAQQFSSADKSPAVVEPPGNADIKPTYKFHKDSVSVDEAIVSTYKTKKKDTSSFVYKRTASAPVDLLKSKADGVTVTTDQNFPGRVTHMKTLNGVVIGQDNGQPLPGATVKVEGSRFGAVTDANGRFALPNVADDQTLSVGYLGYTQKKVKVNDKDSMNISLRPAGSSLNEVVVVNPNANKADHLAHPRDGYKVLEAYLEKNATSPDGQTGKVKVSFVVIGNGTLTNFKITKSLSNAADQKAQELLKGTIWVGNADGTPKEVTVTVKFK